MSADGIQPYTETSSQTEIRQSDAHKSAPDYSGYQPLTFADLAAHQKPLVNDAVADRDGDFDDGTLSESEFESSRIAKISLTLVGLLLLFCLLVFIPRVACGIQLCDKMDSASISDPGFMVYSFIFPYQFVWGAFTTGVGGIFAVFIHLFMLSDKQPSSTRAIETALNVRKGSKIFLRYEYFCELIGTFPLFVLIGFGVSWSTAGSFLFGVFLATLSGWFSMHIATYGSIRVTAEAESQLSFPGGINAIFRAAAAMTVLTMSLAVAGIGLVYLVFRNIRGLLGFAAGVSYIALTSRVASGIYAAATETAGKLVAQLELDMPNDDPRNPVTTASRVADNVEGATGIAVEFFESLVSSVIATAILATCLPYVQNNSYALCVYNHLHIDHACVAYAVATVKLSFAGQLCRDNDFYKEFPSIFFMESNSVFVAVPFLISILGLLTSLVCSVRIFLLKLEIVSDRRKNMLKALFGARVQVVIASLLFFLGCVSIAYGFFGVQSNFQRRLSRDIFPRRELTSSNDTTRCIPTQDITGNTGDNLPVLLASRGPYRPTNILGAPYPKATEIPWRVLVCLLLGLFVGVMLRGLAGFFTVPEYPLTKSVARMGECSAEDVIIQGLGSALSSTAIPFMLVLSTVLGSFSLLGSYGIGLSAVSMISSSGTVFLISAFDTLAISAGGVSRMHRRPESAQNTIEDLGSVGNVFAVSFRSLCAGASVLTTFALIAEFTRMTNLVPSPIEIIGVRKALPLRHISSIDNLSATSPNVVVSVLLGVLLPVVFVALPLLGMSRTAYAVVVETRRQFRENPELRTNPEGTAPMIKKCVRIATKYALFEAVLPLFIILVVPQMVGFGLGQRALVGLLLGFAGCGFLLGTFVLNASSSWQNAKKLVESEHFGAENGKGSQWHQSVTMANAVGVFLKRTSAPSLSIAIKLMTISSIFVAPFMQADASKWFIGLAILGAAVVMTIGLLLVSHMYQRRTRKWARRSIIERITRSEDSDHSGDFEKLEDLRVSPFFEEGMTVARRRIAPTSALAHARIDPMSLATVPEHALRNRRSRVDNLRGRESQVSTREN